MLESITYTRQRRRWLGALLAATLLGACSGTTPTAEPVPQTAPPRTRPTPVLDDVLIVGALLPSSGEGATFGAPLEAGVRMALADINDAGGLDGRLVELISADEGESPIVAAAAVSELVAKDADVIVGPASSRRALTAVPASVAGGVTICSPTATAMAIDDVPDEGLFVRTIAGDEVEMAALADQVERRGETNVLIVAPTDEYGVRLSAALVEEFSLRGITIVETVGYDPLAERHDVSAAAAVSAKPRVIVFLGTPATGGPVLAEIRTRLRDTSSETPLVVLNGAMRSIETFRALGGDTDFASKLVGVSPNPSPVSREFVARLRTVADNVATDYAAYAYDCVMLAALASLDVGPDAPRQIAENMIEASRRGSPCSGFSDCVLLANQGLSIDYSGASGDLDLDAEGDRTSGSYLVFSFDESGRDITIATSTVSAGE